MLEGEICGMQVVLCKLRGADEIVVPGNTVVAFYPTLEAVQLLAEAPVTS